IQQYLQNEHYALWEVIEFGDSYEAPQEESGTSSASESSAKKKGMTIAVTTKDMQKRRNDVKARTTLLLALPDERQLRFNKRFRDIRANLQQTTGHCSKEEEQAPKALMAIDRVGLDWSYMANEEENNALVADEEAPTEFALTAKSSSSSENEIKKEKEGLDSKLTVFFPPPAQVYSPPKKDMSWTGLPEFADDTNTDYIRPSPSIESNLNDLQNSNSSVSEHGESSSTILSKPIIKFVKAADSPGVIKTNKTARKPPVKYAEMYRNTSKSPNVRGNQRNWNNLKSQQLGKEFLMKNKAWFKCGHFDHLAYDCGVWVKKGKNWSKNNFAQKNVTPRADLFKIASVSVARRVNTTAPRPNVNSTRPKTTQDLVIIKLIQRVKRLKGELKARTPPTKIQKVDVRGRSRSVMAWVPKKGNSQNIINDKGYWDSGCFWHMTGNISYLSDYEPYDGGYVVLFTNSECIVLGRDFKLKDDTNVLLRTLRQHNMYSIDLNNIVPHKDLTCLVAKAFVDECLPSKCFKNDHTYVAFLKEKQHKASCKTKLVNLVSKPLYSFHMDLFGPTSDETSGILRNFITAIENLKDLKVKIIRCDNGGKFKNREMNKFCTRKGIKREFSNARTPQQNRVAKRRNRTLIEEARKMLADAKLPVTFWAEAVNTAWKIDAKGNEGYFIGYSMSSKAFRVFNKKTKRIEENLHLDFLENKLIMKGAGPNWLFDIDTLTNSINYVPVVVAGTSSTNFSGTKDAASQDVKKDVSSLRYIAFLNWFHEAHLESSRSNAQDACNADAPESSGNSNPTSTSKNPSADKMETLTVESAIPTVSSPVPTACLEISPETTSGSRLISKKVTSQDETPSLDNISTLSNRTKWVLKNKKDERGIVIRNKARLVAQGHTQEEGFNYEEVFAPVARIKVIRLFLAYASFIGFTVYQMDVKSDFLYGTIDEEVYAPRAWYGTLSKYLLTNGFQKGTIEQTLFIRREFEALMHEKFQMSAMDKYVGDILKKFRYLDVRSANTPMDKENTWGKDRPGKDVDLHLYRSIIGSLMYLTASRPDIMFPVYACARHQVTPKECHLHAVKRIFKYLKGHPKLGLWYPKDSHFDSVAYSNSDYSGATQDRKSNTRGLAFCDYHNMIIILEKSEHNFWSTARIETTNEGTQILTTIDGKPRTICESSIRRNLKLNDEEGISTLPDAELFKNLALMGYNILPNQKFTFQKDEPASPLGDNSQGEAFPTVFGLEVGHDRENIIKTSTLPHESTPRVTSLAADEGNLEISNLKARIKLLEDKDKGTTELSGDDAPIKGRGLETGDEAGVERSTEKGSNDTEEMVNVLTFIDAANILTSGVQALSVPPVGEIPTVGVSTSSGLVPIMAREIEEEMTIYAQRMNEQIARDAEIARIHAKEELQMMIDGLDRNNEMIAKHLHEYEQAAAELTIGEKIELINELVKYQDHHSKILKYQAQQSKPLFKKKQRKFYMSVLGSYSGWKTKHFRGMTLEEIKEKFIPVWKQIKDFVPMDLKEEGERFKRKWLRLEQGSAEMMKTSEEVTEEDLKEMMQLVPVEEVYVEALQVKHPIIDWKIHTEGKRDYWKIIRLGGNTAVYQFFVDMLKQMDREDLNQLWMLVKETLSIRHASSDKEKELWVELKRVFEPDHEDQLWTHTQALMHDRLEWKLYDTCGVHHIFTRDQEIFMLVERDYPLRR
nr:hypothetical protein [Tanacetum cinerariifolium]